MRSFEWYYWDRLWDAATGQETVTLKGHVGAVSRVAFSPDGKRLASASADGTIRLWDTSTAQETLVLKEPRISASCLAFSPDGRRLASASDSAVKIWGASFRKVNALLNASQPRAPAATGSKGGPAPQAARDASAHVRMGSLLSSEGRLGEAIAEYHEVLRLDSEEAYVGMARRNLAHYRESTKQNPDVAWFFSAWAWLLTASADPTWRQPARALELATKAVEIEPNDRDCWNTLGVAHYRNGQFKEAIAEQ